MAATQHLCDLCGHEAVPAVEECWRVECRAQCPPGGADGDVYHAACIELWLQKFAKSSGRAKDISAISARSGAHWPCPKGKGKGSSAEACRGWVTAATVLVHKKPKARPLPQPQAATAAAGTKRGQKGGAAAASAAAAAVIKRPPRKLPRFMSNRASALGGGERPGPSAASGMPQEQADKPDPLGRKTSGGAKAPDQQQLPPGYDPDAEVPGRKPRRRAKAAAGKEEAAPAVDEEAAAPAAAVSDAGPALAIDEQHRALMGGGNFITCPEDLAALLGGMGMLSDEEEEEGGQEQDGGQEDSSDFDIEEQHRVLIGGDHFITHPDDLAALLGSTALSGQGEEEQEQERQGYWQEVSSDDDSNGRQDQHQQHQHQQHQHQEAAWAQATSPKDSSKQWADQKGSGTEWYEQAAAAPVAATAAAADVAGDASTWARSSGTSQEWTVPVSSAGSEATTGGGVHAEVAPRADWGAAGDDSWGLPQTTPPAATSNPSRTGSTSQDWAPPPSLVAAVVAASGAGPPQGQQATGGAAAGWAHAAAGEQQHAVGTTSLPPVGLSTQASADVVPAPLHSLNATATVPQPPTSQPGNTFTAASAPAVVATPAVASTQPWGPYTITPGTQQPAASSAPPGLAPPAGFAPQTAAPNTLMGNPHSSGGSGWTQQQQLYHQAWTAQQQQQQYHQYLYYQWHQQRAQYQQQQQQYYMQAQGGYAVPPAQQASAGTPMYPYQAPPPAGATPDQIAAYMRGYSAYMSTAPTTAPYPYNHTMPYGVMQPPTAAPAAAAFGMGVHMPAGQHPHQGAPGAQQQPTAAPAAAAAALGTGVFHSLGQQQQVVTAGNQQHHAAAAHNAFSAGAGAVATAGAGTGATTAAAATTAATTAPTSLAPAAGNLGGGTAEQASMQATAAALLPSVPTAGAHKHLFAHHNTDGAVAGVMATIGGGIISGGQGGPAVSHQGPGGEEDEDGEALVEELMLMLT